ncbi:MAG: hypothetical protein KY469_03800 [Actinobacteria bacterium]|nr:hypothetical protein [Actinomycetota bacterium]
MTTTTETTIRPGTDPDAGLVRLRARLLDQAYLFDDPAAYAAGVEDTLRALEPPADTAPQHV